MTTLITGATVLPMSADKNGGKTYFTGSVAMKGNRIAIVCDDADPGDALRMEEFIAANREKIDVMDGRGKLVMPGLINTHTHVAMTLMRNMADDLPLMKWLTERVWPLEEHLGREEIAVGARLGIAEMLLGGTTTFVDMYRHESAVAEAVCDMGIRAVLCPSFTDAWMDEFEGDLFATLAAVDGCDRLSVRIAPHSAYTCSPENLRRAIDLAHKYGMGMHTHLSETLDEERIVRERYGCTPTEHLHGSGLFEIPTIAAHCVHLTDSDMDILHNSGVTAAHNPQSNMKLTSGAAHIAEMLGKGVTVSLGTDGAGSNNDLDMWDEMRSASLLGKLTADDPAALPAYEVLKMATVNGARAIGMEGLPGQRGRLGVIAEGALADVIVLDMEKPHLYPRGEITSALVYSAKSSDVDTVFVDGRMVVSGGKIVGTDVKELCLAAERTVDKIKRESK